MSTLLLFCLGHLIFLLKLLEVLVVNTICFRHHTFVELAIPSLVAANQQDSRPARVKGVEDPVGIAANLDPQLSHIAML